MVKVKICGITNLEDALVAVAAGADMLGFIFAPSPRRVTPDQVCEIISRLPDSVKKIGVFVDDDADFVKATMARCHLDRVQLHGDESPEYCAGFSVDRVVKGFRVRDASVLELIPRYKAAAYLLDAYHPSKAGGTGHTFDWDIAKAAKKYGNIILSGGLNPDNVARAIAAVEPHAVDVSSGVELRPGKKDPEKVKAFIRAAKEGERR